MEDVEGEDVAGDKQEREDGLQGQCHKSIEAEYEPKAILVQLLGHLCTGKGDCECVEDTKDQIPNIGHDQIARVRDCVDGERLEHREGDQDNDTSAGIKEAGVQVTG